MSIRRELRGEELSDRYFSLDLATLGREAIRGLLNPANKPASQLNPLAVFAGAHPLFVPISPFRSPNGHWHERASDPQVYNRKLPACAHWNTWERRCCRFPPYMWLSADSSSAEALVKGNLAKASRSLGSVDSLRAL